MSQKERGKKTLLNTNISKVRFRTQSNSSVYYKDTAWHKSCKYACLKKCLVCKKRTKSLAKPGLWSEDCRSHRHFYARVLHLVCHVKMCACTNVCVFVRVLAGGGDRKASKWKPSQWTIRAAAAAGLTGRLWLVRVTLWWRGGVKKKKKKLSRARGKAAGWTCAVCQRQPVLKGSECAHISPSACGEISSRKRSFCASDNKQQQQQSVCARARVCVCAVVGGRAWSEPCFLMTFWEIRQVSTLTIAPTPRVYVSIFSIHGCWNTDAHLTDWHTLTPSLLFTDLPPLKDCWKPGIGSSSSEHLVGRSETERKRLIWTPLHQSRDGRKRRSAPPHIYYD